MRRPQFHRANNSKTWYASDQEGERPPPYEPTPMIPSPGSTAPDTVAFEGFRKSLGHALRTFDGVKQGVGFLRALSGLGKPAVTDQAASSSGR